MIVVISDLHFQDVSRDTLRDAAGRTVVDVRRNVPSVAWRRLVRDIVGDARRAGEAEVDLVLAGDILELNRSSHWFDTDGESRVRPYVHVDETDPATEARLREILAAIRSDPDVSAAFEIFQLFAQGRHFVDDEGDEIDEIDLLTRVHYLPGNHDRLANAAGLRKLVRRLFGVAGEGPLPHSFRSADGRVLVRHGHEYDRFNFAKDLRGSGPVDLRDEDPVYDHPALGDFVTVDIAARLPWLFRAEYGPPTIAEKPLLRALYQRLLEFDDVRPASALGDYLLSTPGFTRDAAWDALQPIARKVLDELAESEVFARFLSAHDVPWRVDVADAVQLLLRTRGMSAPLLREGLEAIGTRSAAEGASDEVASFVARERAVRDGPVSLVIAGHTHHPGCTLLHSRNDKPVWYADCGTWRRRVPMSLDRRSFTRMRTLSWVTVYTRDELRFETWTGHDDEPGG